MIADLKTIDYQDKIKTPSATLPSTSMTPAHLPSELTDRIIDFLHDDRKSLYASSQTCHDFLPCSRYHIFALLTVTGMQAESLAHILSSPLCTIPRTLTNLELETRDPDCLQQIMDYFHTVRHILSISRIANPRILQAFIEVDSARHAKRLILSDCIIRGIEQLDTLVAKRCIGVEKLVLHRIIWIPTAADVSFVDSEGEIPSLTALEFHEDTSAGIVNWFSQHPCSNHLTSFAALSITPSKHASVQNFLDRLAGKLKYVEIGYKLDYSEQ